MPRLDGGESTDSGRAILARMTASCPATSPHCQPPPCSRSGPAYLKPEDLAQLESAYQFSEAAHQGQFRKSGEPYISHPLAVANILAAVAS